MLLFCTVGAAAWSASRSHCRMEAPGRVREPRASLILSCRRTSIMNPPVGGTFWFQISSRPHPLGKFGVKRFLVVRAVAGGEMGWPVLGHLLGKKFLAA